MIQQTFQLNGFYYVKLPLMPDWKVGKYTGNEEFAVTGDFMVKRHTSAIEEIGPFIGMGPDELATPSSSANLVLLIKYRVLQGDGDWSDEKFDFKTFSTREGFDMFIKRFDKSRFRDSSSVYSSYVLMKGEVVEQHGL
jgi:hypothetical protein